MTTVRYFVPEDGDLESEMNVFLAPKPRQQGYPPSLGQVKKAFPLSGNYHFRFKTPLVPGTEREKGAMPVWMDCVDERQPVPTWKNQVIAKVTRIAVEEEDDDDDDDFQRPVPTPAPAPPPQQQSTPPPAMDFFDAGPATHHPTPVPAPQHHHHHHHPSASAAAAGGDLLGGMHPPPTTTPPAQPHHHAPQHGDLLGMSTQMHHTPSVPNNTFGYGQHPQAPSSGGPFF